MCRFRPRLYSYSHRPRDSMCHVEIERAHHTPARRAKNSDKEKPRPIHVALTYDTLINAAFILDERIIPFKEREHKNDERSSFPIKKKSIEETRAKRRAFIAYPGREW